MLHGGFEYQAEPQHWVRVINPGLCLVQGAAEIVLQQCTRFIDTDGSTSKMTDAKRRELLDTVTHMADRGLRTLCLSYRDWQGDAHSLPVEAPDEDLTACAIVGIKVCFSCCTFFVPVLLTIRHAANFWLTCQIMSLCCLQSDMQTTCELICNVAAVLYSDCALKSGRPGLGKASQEHRGT